MGAPGVYAFAGRKFNSAACGRCPASQSVGGAFAGRKFNSAACGRCPASQSVGGRATGVG